VTALELRLVELGRELDVPETPDLAPAVMVQIAQIAPRTRRSPRRRWALAVALAIVAAVGATLAIPPARSAFLRILHIGGEEIRIVDKLPPVEPQQNLELALGPRVTLAEAQQRFPSRLRALDEKPDAVFFSAQTRTVWVLYGTREHVRLLVAQTPGSVDRGIALKKMAAEGTRFEYVDVGGAQGLYLSGKPHLVILLDPNGQAMGETVRLAKNVLLWSESGVAYRLEGELTREKALELAAELRK
jgi:hypothetical protein